VAAQHRTFDVHKSGSCATGISTADIAKLQHLIYGRAQVTAQPRMIAADGQDHAPGRAFTKDLSAVMWSTPKKGLATAGFSSIWT
jgi:hypothetical protein